MSPSATRDAADVLAEPAYLADGVEHLPHDRLVGEILFVAARGTQDCLVLLALSKSRNEGLVSTMPVTSTRAAKTLGIGRRKSYELLRSGQR